MNVYLDALQFSLLFGFIGWIYSYLKTNVNIVDSMWSLFFIVEFIRMDHMTVENLIALLHII